MNYDYYVFFFSVSTNVAPSDTMSSTSTEQPAVLSDSAPDCDDQPKKLSGVPDNTSSELQEVLPEKTSASSLRNNNQEKPFTDEECLTVVKQLFEENIDTRRVHNKYLCQQYFCLDISDTEKKRLLPKKFSHSKLTSYWWLCFLEGEGMYCIVHVCKKFNVKHMLNKRDIFVNTPGTRYLEDALKGHASSSVHKSAIQTELVQKMSIFHQEVCKKDLIEVSLYEKVFWTAYFLMKNFIANRKLLPLLNLIENVYEYENLKYFQHTSAGAQREIFITLGETVKDLVVTQAKKADAFGLLTDEVSDISVTEHLITFIQFFDRDAGKVTTSFLACQDILENFSSANAQAISNLLVESINSSGLDINKLTGFASDGASVMMGKKGGVAALLRLTCPSLINIHCICHRLALSCTDSNESIKYIKDIELLLRQLWQFFDNSPKRMANYLKMQLELKKMDLSKGASKKVATRLKKACRTRWLSFDSSVQAVHSDFEAVLQTLSHCQDEDATALGLLKKMKTIKFLGVIYILREVLPVLSSLSRIFQKDSLSFSAIVPQVNSTKERLDQLLLEETPLTKLQSDIDSITNISAELSLSKSHLDEIQTLFQKYITALKSNIDKRFSDSSEIVSAFCIFVPLAVPEQDADGFTDYGVKEIKLLGSHFYRGEESEDIREQLVVEWRSMKYHLKDIVKPKVPQSVKGGTGKVTSTEWCLLHILSMPVYKQFFPRITLIAEVAASLPVTNAWPERGASALKNLKTRHRNRIKNDMLGALLQVSINGPACNDAGEVVRTAVSNWLKTKERRKLARKNPKERTRQAIPSSAEAAIQTDPVVIADQEEIRAAIKNLALEGLSSDEDNMSSSESELSEDDY